MVAVGEGVGTVAVGDRVLASTGLGGFATHVVVPAASLHRLPDSMDTLRAATFTQSYCTALFALRRRGALVPGESVLVLGAGGGVGLAAVDVATALGARVVAVASSEAKRAAALGAGAVAAVDPGREDLKARARELAGGTGVDLVVDPVGGDLAQASLRALGDGGRYLVIGFASGTIPSLPLNQVLLRNRSVVGVDWGAWAMGHGDRTRGAVRRAAGPGGRRAAPPGGPEHLRPRRGGRRTRLADRPPGGRQGGHRPLSDGRARAQSANFGMTSVPMSSMVSMTASWGIVVGVDQAEQQVDPGFLVEAAGLHALVGGAEHAGVRRRSGTRG